MCVCVCMCVCVRVCVRTCICACMSACWGISITFSNLRLFIHLSFSQTIFDNSFKVTKLPNQCFYYLVHPFVENDRLECEYTITASRTVFVSCCVASD